MYSKEVLDHFTNPRNMGRIENPDGLGEVGNPHCGDMMAISIKVIKEKIDDKEVEKISDIKFETLGCAAAIATSSMVTEIAKGKSVEDALKISYSDVVGRLGELPSIKVHCSDLAVEGLQAAIADYRQRNPKPQ